MLAAIRACLCRPRRHAKRAPNTRETLRDRPTPTRTRLSGHAPHAPVRPSQCARESANGLSRPVWLRGRALPGPIDDRHRKVCRPAIALPPLPSGSVRVWVVASVPCHASLGIVLGRARAGGVGGPAQSGVVGTEGGGGADRGLGRVALTTGRLGQGCAGAGGVTRGQVCFSAISSNRACHHRLHCPQFSVPDLCVRLPSVQWVGSGARSLPPFSTVPGRL